jgi:hypothetical protein
MHIWSRYDVDCFSGDVIFGSICILVLHKGLEVLYAYIVEILC